MSTTPRTDAAALSERLRRDGQTCVNQFHGGSLCETYSVDLSLYCHVCFDRKVADTLDRLTRERDLAIAHDRQPYPTAEAYERVCAAWRKRCDEAALLTAERDALTAALASSEARVREAWMAGFDYGITAGGWFKPEPEKKLSEYMALHAPPSGETAGVTPCPHRWVSYPLESPPFWRCSTCGTITETRPTGEPTP